MVRVSRVALFDREIREQLSSSAVEILLGKAHILSEGKCSSAATGGPSFYGSTMFTIDLSSTGTSGTLIRETCDARLARKLAELMGKDSRVTKRVRQIACGEAERLAGGAIKSKVTDVRVRAQLTQIYIDVDVEGPCA